MLYAFIYGIILSFGLIIPLGVQNIFVFNQGATQGHFLRAFPSVLAASICDGVLIALAILGISVVVLSIAWLKTLIFIIGFCFLIYMGWITWNNQPANANNDFQPFSAKRQMAFAISVSLLNPHAILDTIGVIGTSSLSFSGAEKWVFALACILVSCCWFFGLSVAGHSLKKIDTNGNWLIKINKLSAIVIWSIAIYIAWQIMK